MGTETRRYRRKSTDVDAIQFTGNHDEVCAWLGGAGGEKHLHYDGNGYTRRCVDEVPADGAPPVPGGSLELWDDPSTDGLPVEDGDWLVIGDDGATVFGDAAFGTRFEPASPSPQGENERG